MDKEPKIVPLRKEQPPSCSYDGCTQPAAVSELGANGVVHLCAKHFAEAISGKNRGFSPFTKCG